MGTKGPIATSYTGNCLVHRVPLPEGFGGDTAGQPNATGMDAEILVFRACKILL